MLMETFIFKNYKFLHIYGDFAHCTSRFSSSKYKCIFNSGKQAVHVLPFFLSLHLWCWGFKQGSHCNSTAELHPQPFSLGLHVSVYCFPYHVFFVSTLLEKEEDIIPSLYSAVKLLSLHCWLLTERAGYLCGYLCFTTFHAMACCTPHFRAETLWHR